MFSIVVYNILYLILPPHKRKTKILEWVQVAATTIQTSYDRLFYQAKWTSEVASFETYLNSEYNLPYVFANRDTLIASTSIIYIENSEVSDTLYIFNKVENVPPNYICNKWKSGTTYSIEKRVSYLGNIYRSKVNGNIGNIPSSSPTEWELIGVGPYLYNHNDPINLYDFIVWVPNTLTFDTNVLKSQINKYRYLGKTYQINTY